MQEIVSKEELEAIKAIRGEVRGSGVRDGANFLVKKRGEEALKKLERAMARLGYPINYRKIKRMELFPLSVSALNLLTTQRLFNLEDKHFEESGAEQAKLSVLPRLLIESFVSTEKAIEFAPKIWNKNYTTGSLEIVEFSRTEKKAVVRIKDFTGHRLHYLNIKGYLKEMASILSKSEKDIGKIDCIETKSVFRGDPYHEFILTW